jgi:hypothetical protein
MSDEKILFLEMVPALIVLANHILRYNRWLENHRATLSFALSIGAPIVADAYFIDTYARYTSYFSGYFRLKAKPIFLIGVDLEECCGETSYSRFSYRSNLGQ